MEDNFIRKIFTRYVRGSASSDERKTVHAWYAALERNEQPDDTAAAQKQVWNTIETKLKQQKQIIWFRAAAALVFTISIAGVWLLSRPNEPLPSFTMIQTDSRARQQFELADGTQLTLNKNSRVKISNQVEHSRQVELIEGEVFFEVARDEARPFTIQTGKIKTEVLGTSFNIRAYQQLEHITVSVVSGKVKISGSAGQSYILTKNQALVYNKQDSTFSSHETKPAIGWMNGNIVLDNSSFTEMAVEMKNAYGVTVITTDSKIRTGKYTAHLDTTLTAQQAMEVLAAIHSLRVTTKQDTLMVHD